MSKFWSIIDSSLQIRWLLTKGVAIKMIRLASWNPAYPNKSYHHELAVSSHLIIKDLDCLELKNNIKAVQHASGTESSVCL